MYRGHSIRWPRFLIKNDKDGLLIEDGDGRSNGSGLVDVGLVWFN